MKTALFRLLIYERPCLHFIDLFSFAPVLALKNVSNFLEYLCNFTQGVVSLGEITSAGTKRAKASRTHSRWCSKVPASERKQRFHELTNCFLVVSHCRNEYCGPAGVCVCVCMCVCVSHVCAHALFFPPHLAVPHCPEGNGNGF